jgi:hypothetical protein
MANDRRSDRRGSNRVSRDQPAWIGGSGDRRDRRFERRNIGENRQQNDGRRWDRDRNTSRGGDNWWENRRGDRGDRGTSWQWGRGSYDGYKNYGQYRSAQVHARNADRRANRDWYSSGRYYDRYYDDYDYYDTRYSVIRNIIRTRIYNTYYDDSWYYPSYSSYYYGTPYEPVYGSPLTVNYIYYGTPYYSQPSYYSYVPQYGYYDPYYYGYDSYYPSYSYSNYGGYYPGYSSYGGYYPTYSSYGYYDDGYGYSDPYYSYVNDLPVGDLVYQIAGNSFLSELLGSFLQQGYDQGYMDAQYARDYGYGEESYYDPYAYSDTSYVSYSLNAAENRRIFSEGYEAGYQDAMMARNDDYYPYEDSQPDLIGLLIGNVLSGV